VADQDGDHLPLAVRGRRQPMLADWAKQYAREIHVVQHDRPGPYPVNRPARTRPDARLDGKSQHAAVLELVGVPRRLAAKYAVGAARLALDLPVGVAAP